MLFAIVRTVSIGSETTENPDLTRDVAPQDLADQALVPEDLTQALVPQNVSQDLEKGLSQNPSQNLPPDLPPQEENLTSSFPRDSGLPPQAAELTCSYDAGWQKRGNQKSYNSMSGKYMFNYNPL